MSAHAAATDHLDDILISILGSFRPDPGSAFFGSDAHHREQPRPAPTAARRQNTFVSTLLASSHSVTSPLGSAVTTSSNAAMVARLIDGLALKVVSGVAATTNVAPGARV